MATLYTFLILSCIHGDGLVCQPIAQRPDLLVTECAALAARTQPGRSQHIVCRIQR